MPSFNKSTSVDMYKYIHIRPGVDRVKPLSDIFKIWNREEVTQNPFGNHKFNRTS